MPRTRGEVRAWSPSEECRTGEWCVGWSSASEPGTILEILELGATVRSLVVPVGHERRRSVALGHPRIVDYLASTAYLGASIGRYANRIEGASFELDGRTVSLAPNDRGSNLHGGPAGFDRQLWTTTEATSRRAVLELISPDGDQGFPGELRVRAAFEVDADSVRVEYSAATDRPTVINLTNHTYFNLDGDGDIRRHRLSVAADKYTPVSATGLPLGPHHPVDGTAFDLRHSTLIRDVLESQDPQVTSLGGLDHNFVTRGSGLRDIAVLDSSTDRPAADRLERSAGPAGVHRQHLRRSSQWFSGCSWPLGRRRARTSALPGLPEPARVAERRPASRRGIPHGHDVAVRELRILG